MALARARWKVEHNCPQCGAPVALTEDERVLTCTYCKVRLYVAAKGTLRYCLPPRNADVGSIVMAPYWRVRGQIYTAAEPATEVSARILDDTRLACQAPGLPPSLGVRPQAMSLRFASAELSDRFVSTSQPPPSSSRNRARKPGTRVIGDPLFEIPIVPAASIVYLPIRLARGVFDAVGSRRLGTIDADAWLAVAGGFDPAPPAVTFLATLCPWCSWQLDCHPESLVLTCGLCRAAWMAGESKLTEFPYAVLRAGNWDAACHVPFWRIRADVTGAVVASRADLVRFANLPRVVRPGWEREPLDFWVPAFTTSPEQFLRYSRTLTIGRPEAVPAGREHEGKPVKDPWPVTLPAACLPNAVKALLADLGTPKCEILPLMAHVDAAVRAADLVYVPLADTGAEFRNPGLPLLVHKNLRRE